MGLLDSSGLSSTPTTSKTTSPSSDIQPYVKTVLDKGEALLNADIPAYKGQMTAGPSEYQTQAWQGLANLSLPSNLTTAGQDLGSISKKAMDYRFDPNSVNQYMNPYLQQALEPQLAEMRRQSQINLQPSLAKLTQAGGYGGGRQAIMESEAGRNLLDLQTKYTGQGYKDAYDTAMKAAQYAADLGLRGLQQATSASQAQGNVGAQEASYGLQNLQALSAAGKTQQEQNQAAFNAQYNEWLRQQKYLPDMLKLQQGLIQGMPGGTQENTYTAKPSALQSLVGGTTGVADIVKNMKAAGVNMDTIGKALKSIGIDLSKFKTDASGNITGEYTEDPFGGFPEADSGGTTGGDGASLPPDLDPGYDFTMPASPPPDLGSEINASMPYWDPTSNFSWTED